MTGRGRGWVHPLPQEESLIQFIIVLAPASRICPRDSSSSECWCKGRKKAGRKKPLRHKILLMSPLPFGDSTPLTGQETAQAFLLGSLRGPFGSDFPLIIDKVLYLFGLYPHSFCDLGDCHLSVTLADECFLCCCQRSVISFHFRVFWVKNAVKLQTKSDTEKEFSENFQKITLKGYAPRGP